MGISEFIFEYFGKTIALDHGYNLINTITYGLFALIIYFLLVRPIIKTYLKQLNIKFFLSISFFVLSGAILRVIEEPYSTMNLINRSTNPLELGFYFITPGIYFLILGVIGLSILTTILINKIWNYDKINILLGISMIIFLPLLSFAILNRTHLGVFLISLICIGLIVIVIYYTLKLFDIKLSSFELFGLLGQTTDGFATFAALTFFPYFSEQHVFSGLLIDNLGAWSFLAVKIMLSLVIMIYLRETKISKFDKRYILLFLLILGFATGGRDLFSIACHLI